MKKILFFSYLLALAVSTCLSGHEYETSEKKDLNFSTAFSAGYVFKNDCRFKEVYGKGMINAITADACYYLWEHWDLDFGIGAKLSYWRAKGKTTFLKQCTIVQELPVTLYLRLLKRFACDLQLYASLGGGFIWTKEKSYLGHVRFYKGIGEVEVGLTYPVWRCVDVTGAFRYLFPPQSQSCHRVNVGGFDLRAGIGFSF